MDQPEGAEIWCKGSLNEWNLSAQPTWNIECEYVINDSYSEYRKAIEDSKTVQYLNIEMKWVDLPVKYSFQQAFKYNKLTAEDYRIKPDEPEFKVGDWVIHNDGTIGHILAFVPSKTNQTIQVQWPAGMGVSRPSSLTIWEPTNDELVVCNYRNGRCIVEPYDPNNTDYYTIQPLIYDFTIYK